MSKYDHSKIEKKWQKRWEKSGIFEAKEKTDKPKYYSLMEFPYPSGDGLHAGHVRGYTAMDIITRKRQMEGYNVLYPIGWDAFGLPTENFALKTGKDPRVITKQNTDNFREQFKSLGMSFDWSREINTTDPKYYKWTQWIFLQFLKKGLAYKAKATINWCPKDKIGLANEEVVDGKCERCGTPVEKREKEQWMLAITKYAERLDKDLDDVDYPERVKTQQRNWIGKSEGAEINFEVDNLGSLKIFTTRPDTIFGATYLVLAPEHPMVQELQEKIENKEEVVRYIVQTKNRTEIDRTAEGKEKTGVELKGIKAVNPATKEEIQIWIADYVLPHYGTGAIMAVPAHDERDFEFAKKYDLPIKEVIVPNIIDEKNPPVSGKTVVERKNVHPIVRDPKTGKYLAIKWRNFPWTTFPMGGVEDGEDIVEAAKREVREETGFINLKLIKVLEGTVRAEYFAAHKDQNRVAFTRAVVFDLIDHEQVELNEEEKNNHDIIWLNKSELNYNVMTHAEVGEWGIKMNSKNGAYTKAGVLVNSDKFNGGNSIDVKDEIIKFVGGEKKTTFKLRDWIFSRQRYWGEPIPVIHCEKCGVVPVPEKDLPVELPKVKNYQPTDTGESPLAAIDKWVNVKCPQCGGKAKRETDVMPNWAGSSWYFYRYCDPHNGKVFASKEALEKWLPVDWYNGGMEHTTLHLLYSRFWHKFLFDEGLVLGHEPYKKRTSHGLILAEGGEKMSKSRGNVINPDEIVKKHGADTLRIAEMFIGPFEQAVSWSVDSIVGPRRFLERVYALAEKVSDTPVPLTDTSILEKTIEKVSRDIESMSFNTAISQLMILVNTWEKEKNISQKDFKRFISLLAPFAPHIAEELWEKSGGEGLASEAEWPQAESVAEDVLAKVAVQINGKTRGVVEVAANASEDDVRKAIENSLNLKKFLTGPFKRFIYVPGKVASIVIE